MSDLEQMKDYCEIHREHMMTEVKQLIDSRDASIKNDLERTLSKTITDLESRLLLRMDDRFKRFDEKQDVFNATLQKILWVLIGTLVSGVIILVGIILGKGIEIVGLI